MLIKNLFRYWTYQIFSPGTILREKYESFKTLLEHDKAAHEHMASLEDLYYRQKKFDFQAVIKTYGLLACSVSGMVDELLTMCPSKYWSLKDYFKKFDFYVQFMLVSPEFEFSPPFTIEFESASLLNESIAGKKAYALSVLSQRLELPIPKGFVITTNAFHYFLEYNGLRDQIDKKLAALDINCAGSLEQTAREIEKLISTAVLPEGIETAIIESLDSCMGGKDGHLRLALRSSAVKEDGKTSFAGQYRTHLNVNPEEILSQYKAVLAGKYSARALYYRISHGILDDETPMAVIVMEMVDSKTSGVVYTNDIGNLNPDHLLIHSVKGQGEQLVDGKVSPDVIKVPKKISEHTLNKDLHISEASALKLTGWGVLLETYFNQPQDIEWCEDKSGELYILQSRPLNLHPDTLKQQKEPVRDINNKVLCSKAESASPGIASGRVFRMDTHAGISQIPRGSVLVVSNASPSLVKAIDRMNAIVIETGSCASHFSSIAREFSIPTLVNPEEGFNRLVPGKEVTVDADNCIVYEGIIELPVSKKTWADKLFQKSSYMRKLRYVINFCARLRLADPSSDMFKPEGCRSLHDIIRFAHETAVKEMFFMGSRKGGRKKGARKLVSSIPMLFYILDVGAGIREEQKSKNEVTAEDIISIPMKALLTGLSDPGICWSETTHFDWEQYDKIAMAGGIISADAPQFGSYAVLSEEYLNVNFRFGYHFVILDTICSASEEDNYILFRFSGGGGSPEGRMLRANFIKAVLMQLRFKVEIKSDLVDAELKKGSLKNMKKILNMIGRLLGATKLMDMYIDENQEIEFMTNEFMNGRYDFRSGSDLA